MRARDFTPDEDYSLRIFNAILTNDKLEYSRKSVGQYNQWLNALKEYSRNGNDCKFLLYALLKMRPHDYNMLMSLAETDYERLIIYFRKSSGLLDGYPLCMDENLMYSPVSTERYMRETKSVQDEVKTEIDTPLTQDELMYRTSKNVCLVHSERPVANKKRRLCASCYNKVHRLGLMDQPVDSAMVEVLSTRLSKYTSPYEFCRRHPTSLAMPNGLCVICNKNDFT